MAPKRDDGQVPHKGKKEKKRCGECNGTIGLFGSCHCAQRERRRKRDELLKKQEKTKDQRARQRAKEGLG